MVSMRAGRLTAARVSPTLQPDSEQRVPILNGGDELRGRGVRVHHLGQCSVNLVENTAESGDRLSQSLQFGRR